MAASLAKKDSSAQMEFGHNTKSPVDFTDSSQMLGASPALLQGKIIRGGMGTGMPYWVRFLPKSKRGRWWIICGRFSLNM